jgi:putative membrane protein
MLIYIIIAILLGLIAGCITGLTPGIHINLIAIIVLSASSTLLGFTNPLTLAIFIISMAITHTFVDFIPSIFLGAPDEDSFLSILPGHKLLLKGRGYIAIILTVYGSLAGLLIILIFTPLFIYFLPTIYPIIQNFMPFILIIVSTYLIYQDKKNWLWSLIIFILAGFLGIASLNLNLKEPLLPLLTGLFGGSSLITSLINKPKIPKQKIHPIKSIRIQKKSLFKSCLASIIAAPFTAFLPGLGASQAAVIGKEFLKIKDNREFLFLLGAINTIVMGLSFITLYTINKTRTGAAVAISNLLPNLTLQNLIIILSTITIAGIFSFFITIFLAKIFSRNINKINYQKLSRFILIVLMIIVLIFTDFLNILGSLTGILIFIISTALGTFTILNGIRRMHLMGCLLIPTILFYLL